MDFAPNKTNGLDTSGTSCPALKAEVVQANLQGLRLGAYVMLYADELQEN